MILSQNNFANGRGDFHTIFRQLGSGLGGCRDLKNKLMLLRLGCLFDAKHYPKMTGDSFSKSIEELRDKVKKLTGEGRVLKIYADEVP